MPTSAIDVLLVPPTRDLGDGFSVRRALPSVQRRMVGPFVFFDAFGPTVLAPGKGLDVRPHPHIGLATVTYLFDGEIVHRDSLGSVATIRPGACNWMTAGRGIVHSERTAPELRAGGARLCGLQSWVALPLDDEEIEPSFVHYGADVLPEVEGDGVRARVVAGSLFGKTSPVATRSEMFYADVRLEPGARLSLPADHEERAIFAVTGALELDGEPVAEGVLAVLKPACTVTVAAPEGARLMLLGGTSLGARHVWWNFVASSRDRIEAAKEDWRHGRFAAVPGETEFIPLPEGPPPNPPVVKYP